MQIIVVEWKAVVVSRWLVMRQKHGEEKG